MVAPIIPGLHDSEVPAILEAAADAGARSASHVLLRLPLSVRPVFVDWLERTQPLKKERIESRIRSTRDGNLNDSEFGRRMRGQGSYADQISEAGVGGSKPSFGVRRSQERRRAETGG